MEVNLVAVLCAAVAMFVVGAIWYSLLFGKAWGEIHGFDKLSKKTQLELQSKMGPFYVAQALVTFLSAYMLAYFMHAEKDIPVYVLASALWVGFALPAQVSAVMFGGTEGKYMAKKIVIMGAGALAATLVGAWVLTFF